MNLILEAVYDGEVLRPVQPLDLKPNTRLRMNVEADEPEINPRRSFLQTARSPELEGPADIKFMHLPYTQLQTDLNSSCCEMIVKRDCCLDWHWGNT